MAEPDLSVLAGFLSQLEHPDFSPGHWPPLEKRSDGSWPFPYPIYSAAVEEFEKAACEGGWISRVDWLQWSQTEEANEFWQDPGRISQATARQIDLLLTVFFNMEKFCDGELLFRFESGHILAIVRRAAALLEAAERP